MAGDALAAEVGGGMRVRWMESVTWPQATTLLTPDTQNHLKNADSWALHRGPWSAGLGPGPGMHVVNELP